MTTHDDLEKHLKKTTIWSNVIGLASAIVLASGIGYSFYYKTNDTLEDHDKEFIQIHKQLNEISDKVDANVVYKGVSENEINNIKDQVQRIEDKQDRMIELLVDIKRGGSSE